jgi:hypothetical protein
MANNATNIAAAGTTTLFTGKGTLHSVVVNSVAATSSVVVYDNTSAAGTKLATIGTVSSYGSFIYDVAFNTGLTVVVTGTPDVTVCWSAAQNG